MAGMMTLAGYVLVGHGHPQGSVFPVLSAHFIGMFGLMPIVGNIIDRLGRLRALVGGLLLIGFCSLSVVWVVESITATFYGPSWAPAVAFGLLLLTLAFRPAGLLGR